MIVTNGNIFKTFQKHCLFEKDILTKENINKYMDISCDIYSKTLITLDDNHQLIKINYYDHNLTSYVISYVLNINEYKNINIEEYLKSLGLILDTQEEIINTPVGDIKTIWNYSYDNSLKNNEYIIKYYFTLK